MNYSTMKVADLRQAAAKLGIMNTDKMKKTELIQLLENVQKLRDPEGKRRASFVFRQR